MNRIWILTFYLFASVSGSLAGDHCDLSRSIGVQNDKSQVIGVKNLISGFSLVVPTQSCKKSMPGDACAGAFNPGSDISSGQRNEIAKLLRMQPGQLVFIKKPDVRQPASFSSGEMVGKCL